MKGKYPKLFNYRNENLTILCEYESPQWRIVEHRVDEPTLTLIGAVRHEDYSYLTQRQLDELAIQLDLPRPEYFCFDSVLEAVESVKDWGEGEGIVIYSECGQILKKSKASRYLALHKIKSNLNSEKSMVEYWFSVGCPKTSDEFRAGIEFELIEFFEPYIALILKANLDFESKLEWMREHLEKQPEERKGRALWIQTLPPVKQKIGFLLLSGKEESLDKPRLEYILEQIKR